MATLPNGPKSSITRSPAAMVPSACRAHQRVGSFRAANTRARGAGTTISFSMRSLTAFPSAAK
jgi:hypothetical protein